MRACNLIDQTRGPWARLATAVLISTRTVCCVRQAVYFWRSHAPNVCTVPLDLCACGMHLLAGSRQAALLES